MARKYDDDCCGCEQVETEEHALFEGKRYGEERGRWRGVFKMKEYDLITGYQLESDEIEKETLIF